MGDGVQTTVIHGVVRPNPEVGQTYAKGSASAPIILGEKGGIIVEGINPNAPAGTVTVTDTSVGDISIEIMAANPNRKSNIFQNNGTVNVYLGFDVPAVAGQGITLVPNVAWESDTIFQGIVYAVVTTGGGARVTVLQS